MSRFGARWFVDVWVTEVSERGVDHARSPAARAALRRLVGTRRNSDPLAVALGHDDRGRPLVLDDRTLQVSISHSGTFVACAAARREVGVDIERSDRPEADYQLAQRVCAPAELSQLDRIPPNERRLALVRMWVRKEAWAKALGIGLELPLACVDVRRGTPVYAGTEQKGWTIHDLPVPEGYLAAVAVRGRRVPVRMQLHLMSADSAECEPGLSPSSRRRG